FTAKRDEYYGLTELTSPNLLSVVSGDIITPTIIPGSDIDSTLGQNTNPGEQWEGQLVKIEDVEVAAPVDSNISYVGSDDGWLTTFIIGDNVDYQFDATGDILDNVISTGEAVDIVGVVDYDWGSYRLNPRDSSDITGYASADPNPNLQDVNLSHYPNPVNSTTTISFNLPAQIQQNAEVKIYNLQGQLINTLHPESNTVNWNCKNKNGTQVANGIYFYSLQTDNATITNKMILMK
ncbi:MAG: T9SS type A sorting domain-containing protein, partial [Candidatus Cloacimonetes bacterium]|nr:T9SS type A sorting domain-containing protein [Candidatus Cloacimonadota bacterium]